MRSVIIFFTFLFSLFLTFAQLYKTNDENLKAYKIAEKYFNDATKISYQTNYDEAKEIELNTQALNLFNKINLKLTKGKDDSLAFFCHLKSAILYHYFDSINLAKSAYLKCINVKSTKIADSFLFQPLLFIGIIYYSQNNFDSSYEYYKKAEIISDKYSIKLDEEERLYNGLGSMFYETGNYKQAKNYYEKAISILNTSNTDFLIRYKSNIASCFLKLEEYQKADSIYKSLLQYKINENEIFQNLGSIQLQLGNSQNALNYFYKVNFKNNLTIQLNNKIGKAFLLQKKIDSANKYFEKSIVENNRWNASKRNNPHGVSYQYIAEKNILENNFKEAINNYQQAILQFFPAFNETNIYKNPQQFTGVFSYINLFNALTAKAEAFESLYNYDKDKKSLDASIDAYRSAFLLADYVEKSYYSDEARLFLSKIKYKVHDKPIHICIKLFELTKNNKYLEDAYLFDQQNKASVLSLNLQENSLKNEANGNASLFKKEKEIKTNITRLSLKAAQASDNAQLMQAINTSIRENEIALSKLQDEINNLPNFKGNKLSKLIPTVSEVQQSISKQTAIISYHLSSNELLILNITQKEISYSKQQIDNNFFNNIKLFKESLSNNNGEQKYQGTVVANKIYNFIIKPILGKISTAKNLIIIPDDELNNLPIEALYDDNGNYMLQKFTVQYQYSTSLLLHDFKNNTNNNYTLAMAPFVSNSTANFSNLNYTKNEIQNLQGKILIDSGASKQKFLEYAESSSIIHLATHTIINDSIPENSLIAFFQFPNQSSIENNLYLKEIYNLNLNNTKLVVLSACETGTGKLAKGEGLMSLSRAFAYSGCPSVISSLWKADDKATAWIMQKFYTYYSNGDDAAISLQKAKLDYLKSTEIDKKYKSPNYWTHLVLTGLPSKPIYNFTWLWVLAILTGISTIIFFFYKKRIRHKHNKFSQS